MGRIMATANQVCAMVQAIILDLEELGLDIDDNREIISREELSQAFAELQKLRENLAPIARNLLLGKDPGKEPGKNES
jgi:hypothetical protein